MARGSKTSRKAVTAASATVGALPGLTVGLLQAAHPALAPAIIAQCPPVKSRMPLELPHAQRQQPPLSRKLSNNRTVPPRRGPLPAFSAPETFSKLFPLVQTRLSGSQNEL